MNKASLVAALAFCLAATGAAGQSVTTLDLTLDQARALAQRAFTAGDRQLAYQIARELVEADPQDRDALLLLAATAPDVGQPEEGRRAGARAHALSRTPVERYEAARVTALAAARAGQFTRAQFWLRRALIDAPTEAERERTTRDAADVARRNPLALRFSFSVVPSNNVNGGAEDETLTAPGLPDGTLSADALALEGIRASLRLGVTWRLAESPAARTSASLDYSASRVRIDPEEEAGVPDSAFATDLWTAALAHERRLGPGTAGARLAFGSYDYGGEDYYDFRRLTLSYGWAIRPDTALQTVVQREWQDYESEGIGEIMKTAVSGTLSRRLGNGDRVSGGLSFEDSLGDSVNYTYTDRGLSVGYDFGRPIGPLQVGLSAGMNWTDYDDYILIFPVDGGREDRTIRYGATIGLPDAQFAGFYPSMSISGSRTESNISRFTRSTLSVGFNLVSTF